MMTIPNLYIEKWLEIFTISNHSKTELFSGFQVPSGKTNIAGWNMEYLHFFNRKYIFFKGPFSSQLC